MTLYNTFYNKLTSNITGKLKVKGWEKIYFAKVNEKKAGVARLTSYNVHFRERKIIRDGEEHYVIMIKMSIHQEATHQFTAILNVYA